MCQDQNNDNDHDCRKNLTRPGLATTPSSIEAYPPTYSSTQLLYITRQVVYVVRCKQVDTLLIAAYISKARSGVAAIGFGEVRKGGLPRIFNSGVF